ncbi:hypothetical protein [Phenylobacterium sp. J367]|uniref:hypothetical protein n=1 Tax=Phenylobacterium sp. J367 TaxID=2898435 RepID=UPI002150A01F|nr:hypothetical protein [Phenylobacterium sp. J367]MCR5877901.1 hypothetical protein [Phenylobacterium sp. J367]
MALHAAAAVPPGPAAEGGPSGQTGRGRPPPRAPSSRATSIFSGSAVPMAFPAAAGPAVRAPEPAPAPEPVAEAPAPPRGVEPAPEAVAMAAPPIRREATRRPSRLPLIVSLGACAVGAAVTVAVLLREPPPPQVPAEVLAATRPTPTSPPPAPQAAPAESVAAPAEAAPALRGTVDRAPVRAAAVSPQRAAPPTRPAEPVAPTLEVPPIPPPAAAAPAPVIVEPPPRPATPPPSDPDAPITTKAPYGE